MAKELTPFRRSVKIALLAKEMTSTELAERINEATGRHYNASYLAKVCDGERWSPCVMEHICRFLELPFPEGYWNKRGDWHGETGQEDKA